MLRVAATANANASVESKEGEKKEPEKLNVLDNIRARVNGKLRQINSKTSTRVEAVAAAQRPINAPPAAFGGSSAVAGATASGQNSNALAMASANAAH